MPHLTDVEYVGIGNTSYVLQRACIIKMQKSQLGIESLYVLKFDYNLLCCDFFLHALLRGLMPALWNGLKNVSIGSSEKKKINKYI